MKIVATISQSGKGNSSIHTEFDSDIPLVTLLNAVDALKKIILDRTIEMLIEKGIDPGKTPESLTKSLSAYTVADLT